MPKKSGGFKMAKMKNMFFILLTVVALTGSTFLVGCGGGVDEEQIQMLNDLIAEVDAMTAQLNSCNDQKADLQKQIADSEAQIQEWQNMAKAVNKNCP
ncbi:MAG: hypothetical protein K1X85_09280 [Ignavibacteria bacterium]|nr:hypothetical protein [Ignavibacteria bacterium]